MGFDNECILNIQSLAGEYFCPVCRTLVYPSEALQSQCTHLYCKPCLAYVVGTTRACPYDGYLVTEADSKPLVESNKALAETIGKIAVHCLYHRSGCTWQGPLSDCTSHCSGCTFGNSAVICNRCGIQIVHRQVQEHAQSCPGSNPQAQQATENVQDTTTSGTATAASQAQTTTQSVAPTSQPQTSQATAAPPPGQNPNQQPSANPQGQAIAQAAAPTPEQWYQQQYQQYYQQYPGYDPYQQSYQQYYPHQQQIAQQFQQYPLQGQQPQVYTQPQVQPQAQPQAQPQVQPQAQPLPQLHTPSQPQPQIPPHGQSQQHLYAQAPVVAQHHNQAQINPQQQHPAVQPHAPFQPQTHPPPHGHLPPQAQLYPQAQPHPQPQMQLPQYQQPHPQVLHPQLQVQPQAHLQPQPQPQPQPQAQLQNHPQPQPQLPPPPPTQPQGQQSSVHVVSAHHSYPQQPGHPHQQMQPALTQHPMHIHPSSGSLPPTQMHGQFPQQPPPMRPPQSHALVPNQQLPSQGQVASIPPAQQQQIQPHTQQPGHQVHQRPVMQQTQQPYVQQPFPGQTSGPVQSQLNQHGHFAPQQPMQSQLHPQGPPHSLQQHSLTHLQPQQNVTSQQSQNYAGRPVMPNQGVQSQHFTKSPGTFGVAGQVGPMQLGLNQPSGHQNYANRASSQPQESSEQQFVQSGQTTKTQDVASDRSVMGREPGSPSQKTAEKDANGLGADSHNVKALKSETGMNFMNDGKSSTVDKTLDKDASKVGSGEPVIKQAVNEEGSESTLSSLHGGKSVEIASLDGKDATIATPKQAEHSIEDSSLRQAESLDVNKTKLQKDESAKASTVTDRGSKSVALVPSSNLDGSGENVISQGNSQTPLISRDRQLPPMPYGPSTHQQRPTVPSMAQPGHLPGPPPNAQLAGYPPNILRPLGPGHLPPSGQPFNPSDHFQPPLLNQPGSFNPDIPPSGFSVQGSTVPFGRGPAQFGHPQRSFELQSSAPQGQYNQGHMPPPHAGVSRSSQGEPAGGPPLGAVPPSGSYGPQGGIMGRAPTHGPGGQIGLQRPINPVETEMFPNQRSHHFDGRHPDSHVPGYMERGPFGQPSAIESGMPRMNGAPGLDSPSTLGPRDERFKNFSGENMNSFPMGPTQRLGQGEFEEGLKQFPRPSHFGPEPSPKFGSSFPSSRPMDRGPNGLGMDSISRPFDKPPRGFNYDDGLKMDSGERAPPVGFHDDNRGREDRTLGPVPAFGRHHMERPRSPGREFDITSHGFGGPSGVPRGQPSFDDIDGKGTRSFGEGSRSFNLPSDPGGNSFRDSRFPLLPGHLQREIDGHGNSRMGEHSRGGDLIGQDSLPSHLRRGEFPGPHNLPSHMRLGEPTAFGNFPGPGSFPRPVPLGESFGGKKPTHPRLGEPGFRSSYSLHGFPNDGGFYAGDADSFDRLRAKKPSSMGWCRICKVDCETVEGLDLHAQTREHQKMTMDMVVGIKQQNAKKRKTSNDHPSLEEASRSRNAGFEGRNNKS